MHQEALVGRAWAGLKEAYYGDQAESLLIVDYDLLCQAPSKVLLSIYKFIGEPWFEGHDFDNLEFDAPDFDEALGISGMHRVRPKVELISRRNDSASRSFPEISGNGFLEGYGRNKSQCHSSNSSVNTSR